MRGGAHRCELVGTGDLISLMVIELSGVVIADGLFRKPPGEGDAVLKARIAQVYWR